MRRLMSIPVCVLAGLAPVGRLAWAWYVPRGTAICVATGRLAARVAGRDRNAVQGDAT